MDRRNFLKGLVCLPLAGVVKVLSVPQMGDCVNYGVPRMHAVIEHIEGANLIYAGYTRSTAMYTARAWSIPRSMVDEQAR